MTNKEIKPQSVLRDIAPYTADVLNPFVVKQTLTYFQILKSIMLTIVLPLRFTLMFLILLFAWVVGVVTLQGISKEQALGREPLTGWRRECAKPFIVSLARLVFFVGGWYWVPQRGRRATAKEAPILLVTPHSSFFDTAMVIALGCPSMVVKDSTEKTPLFGTLVKYTQPFFVKSEDPSSRHLIAEQIKQRVTSGKDFEQLLIFPEGGCGNRNALLQFKLGGFAPGVPVQPVFIHYHNALDSITWTWDGPGVWKQLWLTLTQFRIKCELEFLPVYNPTEYEKVNPRTFADNVQNYVSSLTGTPITRFALEDARFLQEAKSSGLPLTVALVKLLRLRRTLGRQNMEPAKELDYLKEQRKSLKQLQGDVNFMAKYLGLERCPEALKDYFRLMDQHNTDSMDVRIYDAGLSLLRGDLKAKEKLKIAFKVFGRESRPENLETILLYWEGAPSALSVLKALNYLDKSEREILSGS